jgi:hypothetical protein
MLTHCWRDAAGEAFITALTPPGCVRERFKICYSQVDNVLKLRMVVNFAKRMWQDGPHNMPAMTATPPNVHTMASRSDHSIPWRSSV